MECCYFCVDEMLITIYVCEGENVYASRCINIRAHLLTYFIGYPIFFVGLIEGDTFWKIDGNVKLNSNARTH